MKRIFDYDITDENSGIKISEFLFNRGFSRAVLTFLRHNGDCIFIDNKPVHMNIRLKTGDKLEVVVTEDESSEKIPPVNLPIDIVYEDQDILVINKPAHMPIHPSMKNYENTLGNAVAYYFQSKGQTFVYRCVNRLDKDTTGLTIIAKNMVAAGALYQQMKSRQIYREYTAIVEGTDLPDFGTIDKPLGRKADSAIERCVDYENGDKAVTHYEVIDRDREADLALVKCHLDTGRTHQIRVHMTSIGHPLIGDFLYNPDNHIMDRQALHAGLLRFKHPITGQPMEFTVELPEDMKSVINQEME